MKIVDSAFYQWIKIKNLPLHFWSMDILEKIVSSFGELVRGCKNISEKLNGQDVRILVKVKSSDCIPKSIICSYTSQVDLFTREVSLELIPIGVGQLGSEIIGSHLTALQAQGDEVLDSKWVDQISSPITEMNAENLLPNQVQNQSIRMNVDKGKQVNASISNVAGIEESNVNSGNSKEIFQKLTVAAVNGESLAKITDNNNVPDSQALIEEKVANVDSDSIYDPLQDLPFDLVKHNWKGKTIYIEKSTWDNFFGGNEGGSNSISSSTSFPPTSIQTPAVHSSSSVPPGFSKKAISSSASRARKTVLSQKHRRFMTKAISGKRISKSVKKGSTMGTKAHQVLDMLDKNPIPRSSA
ncbi:uncharacterized protein LOC109848415 [Asparagus officinalis]|uniref:uncharacterized protein LOC109848415 n=1 Tax=Asparagus officinalis TaxID=4686 RepID=UPI00098DE938|nr:uncharacterized protein LOC109848415 [Asparagus officinalis]